MITKMVASVSVLTFAGIIALMIVDMLFTQGAMSMSHNLSSVFTAPTLS